jgi:hypothetical protein
MNCQAENFFFIIIRFITYDTQVGTIIVSHRPANGADITAYFGTAKNNGNRKPLLRG